MGKTKRFKKTRISKVLLQTFKSFATIFHFYLHLYLVLYAPYLSNFTFSRITIIQKKSMHLPHKIILFWLWLRYSVVVGPLV